MDMVDDIREGQVDSVVDNDLKAMFSHEYICGGAEPDDAGQKKLSALRRENPEAPVVRIGTATCGLSAGAGGVVEAMRRYFKTRGLEGKVVQVGCAGLCWEEPLVGIHIPGRAPLLFGRVLGCDVEALMDKLLNKGEVVAGKVVGQFCREGGDKWSGDVKCLDEHPFLARQKRLILKNCGLIDPRSIDEYIAFGGYRAFARTLHTMIPLEVCGNIEKSGLRGRGGGGFLTGKKWRIALQTASEEKYVICNADEGDPGAFTSRAIIEGDPHRVVESIAIAAYAVGASKAFVYIRAEYPLAVECLRVAIRQAEAYGFLGENILDSGFNLSIGIKRGAGAFVCGEETALIHSIEGRRGMPRPRPPYPAERGLFGRPTIINNVETLANIPGIIADGYKAFAETGTEGSKGTKVFAISGNIKRTGLIEVEMGTCLRDIIFGIGGGVADGGKFKAVQIGGPSGGCLPEHMLSIPVDYEALDQAGAMMGSGGLVVLDESVCMVDLAKYFLDFIQRESCGKCIPCREGTRHMLEILKSITRGRAVESELQTLERFKGIMSLSRLADVIKDTSLCGLGKTAPNPVLSTLRWFREEYEAHVYERKCPAGVCEEMSDV